MFLKCRKRPLTQACLALESIVMAEISLLHLLSRDIREPLVTKVRTGSQVSMSLIYDEIFMSFNNSCHMVVLPNLLPCLYQR